MRKNLLLIFAVLAALLPQSLLAATWSFGWNKSHSGNNLQGFYTFGSPAVSASAVTTGPLVADFTTDKGKKAYYEQTFDSAEDLRDWQMGKGWSLAGKGFGKIDSSDQNSLFIAYEGSGTTTAKSPELTIKDGTTLEFYAWFQAYMLVYGKWKVCVEDADGGVSETVFNAFDWAQDKGYNGPAWNKFDIDLSGFAGRKVRIVFEYPFGGEDLAVDGLRLVQDDPAAAQQITVFEGESVSFTSTSTGSPEAVEWTFDGGTPATSADVAPVVRYDKAGTYDVALSIKRGGDVQSVTRRAFVHVAQKAPTASIGLPEEGYESPYVGVFVPTGVPVTFRDLSAGRPTEWNWQFQFADKATSNEQNPTVTFVKKGTVSVGLTAKNDAGQSNDVLQYAIQAGGAQEVWNIPTEENGSIEKIALGFYGSYAGSNWLGITKFAELYKAPLADAEIGEVSVYFASTTTVDATAGVTLTLNAVGADGNPGDELATATLKAGDLKYDAANVVATTFAFDEPVSLKAGTPFFVTIAFPNNTSDDSPYADDIAVYCVRHTDATHHTVWQYQEDEDENYQPLGTYSWVRNVDEAVSMAVAPVVSYDVTPTGISRPSAAGVAGLRPVAVYTIDGRRVAKPVAGGVYVVRYADGSSRKTVVR